MTPKRLFLIVFTAAHQITFWFLLFTLTAFFRSGSASSFGRFVERIMLTLMSPLTLFPPVWSGRPIFLFLVANSFLWALSAWYALGAWRHLRNLPPLEQPS